MIYFDLLCIVILIILLFILTSIKIEPFSHHIKNFNYLNFENLKTGDLIFLSGNTYGENIVKILSNSKFSHVGMVIKIDNHTYLWECDIGQNKKTGVRVIYLDEKLRSYKGSNIIAIRRINKKVVDNIEDFNDKLSNIVSTQINKNFDQEMYVWISDFFGREKNTMFCSELIAYTLHHLGLLKLDKKYFQYSPQDFLSTDFTNEGKKLYSQPEFFIF